MMHSLVILQNGKKIIMEECVCIIIYIRIYERAVCSTSMQSDHTSSITTVTCVVDIAVYYCRDQHSYMEHQAVKNAHPTVRPTNCYNIQRFLGSCTFQRQYQRQFNLEEKLV